MKLKLSYVAAIVVVLGMGCTRMRIAEGTHPPVRIDTGNTGIRYNSVSLTDDSIQGKIGVEASNWSRTPTGNAQVWVQLRNRTDYMLQVEARTQFFDASKAPLGVPSAWQRVMLSPNTSTTYRESSARPDTAYYYVEVREGR